MKPDGIVFVKIGESMSATVVPFAQNSFAVQVLGVGNTLFEYAKSTPPCVLFHWSKLVFRSGSKMTVKVATALVVVPELFFTVTK